MIDTFRIQTLITHAFRHTGTDVNAVICAGTPLAAQETHPVWAHLVMHCMAIACVGNITPRTVCEAAKHAYFSMTIWVDYASAA